MKIQADKVDNEKVVNITASGLKPEDDKEFNVRMELDGKPTENVLFKASGRETPSELTVTPPSINSVHTVDVTLTVTGATGDISVKSDNPAITFEINQSEKQVVVKADSSQTGKLTISEGDKSVEVQVTFTNPKDITLTVTPESKKATKDKSFTVTVTSDDEVSTALHDGTNMKVTPASGKVFTVTCKNATAGVDKLILSKEGYNNKEVDLTFRDKDEITHIISKNIAEVGEEIVITVSGLSEGRELDATSSQSEATVNVEGNLIKVNGTGNVTSNITVKGRGASEPYIEQFTEEVTFTKPKENITATLNPITGYIKKGGTIVATIEGSTSQKINASSDESKITVSPIGRSGKQFNITASERCEGVITFSGPDVNETRVKVIFTEADQPQFYVDKTEVNIKENQVPYSLKVKELVGTLTAKVSSPFVYKTEINENEVKLRYTNSGYDLTKDDNLDVTLNVDGQEPVVIKFHIAHIPEKPEMPCNGLIIKGYENEEIYFNAPTKDSDDEIIATIDSDSVQLQVKDVNRIFVNTSKNAPHGTYKITVKHSEYRDATVTYHCMKKATVIVPPTGEKPGYYDLGPAPEVEIDTTPDDFIKDVFESESIDNDPGRITFVLENGSGSLKNVAHILCGFNKEVGKHGSVPLDRDGGRWNRAVFDCFTYIFGISDYYEFRNHIRLAIKIMKHYRENSFSTLLMMRFDAGWIGNREELSLYRNIAAFLNKYIDANGKNVKVTGLEVTGDGYKNMERYCGENIQP